MLNRPNTAIPSLTPEIPQFLPQSPAISGLGKYHYKITLALFSY